MCPRVVLHVDMDQFFVACERLEREELRGKPIVVGADPKGGRGRGVVSTASYEARKFGVVSGMPISKAYKLCPQCIFLPVNFELYARISRRVMEILRRHAVRFEQWGIDEAFIELTGKVKDFDEAREKAERIKKEIRDEIGLGCTIGVGPNKLIAKIASDLGKPDGLVVVKPHEVRSFLAPLPVRKLLWVGRKTEEALKAMGIELIGELAEADAEMLYERLGKMGPQLKAMAQGIDDSPLIETWEAKSIGSQRTFETDTSDEREIYGKLDELSEEVFRRAAVEGVAFSNVGIVIRFSDFETHTRARTLKKPCERLDELRRIARELAAPFLREGKPIRLVGVRVASLEKRKWQKRLPEFQVL